MRCRFSLRVLLIGIALLASPLGWLANQARETSRQNVIANEIRAAGGVAECDGYFGRVTEVYLIGVEDANPTIKLLADLPDLKSVSLQSSQFSDDALQHLVGLNRLDSLDLQWTPITDIGLKWVGKITSLRELKLNKSYPPNGSTYDAHKQLTDEGIAQLTQLACLEKLIIWGAEITDVGAHHISRCGNLRVLWLTDTKISGAGVHQLAKLKSLERLDLCGTRVSGASLEPLQTLPNLRSLSAARTQVTGDDVAAFIANRPGSFSFGY